MFVSWLLEVCQRHLGRLSWPGLLVLFLGHYGICFIMFSWFNETQLIYPISTFIYYCSVVGSTLGFGDISPHSQGGRLFTALWQIPVGVGLFGAVLGKTITAVQVLLSGGIKGLGKFTHLRGHLLLIGWKGAQTEKMISLLLYDRARIFSSILLCAQDELTEHPSPGNSLVDFARVTNFNDADEQQRIGLQYCKYIIIYAPTDEQTFTIALSLANKVSAGCHIVSYIENEHYARLLVQHCPGIEVVRNLSAEQLTRSVQDPGSSQSVTSLMNPMFGDTGYVLAVPDTVHSFNYGALMYYMKVKHDATMLGISHCRNGKDLELNPEITTTVHGGMWLHLIGNSRIMAQEIAWENIGNNFNELLG